MGFVIVSRHLSEGFAIRPEVHQDVRGFCALSDWIEVQHKCTGVYNPQTENSIR